MPSVEKNLVQEKNSSLEFLEKLLPLATVIIGLYVILYSNSKLTYTLLILGFILINVLGSRAQHKLQGKALKNSEIIKFTTALTYISAIQILFETTTPIWLLHFIYLFRISTLTKNKEKIIYLSILAITPTLTELYIGSDLKTSLLPLITLATVSLLTNNITNFLHEKLTKKISQLEDFYENSPEGRVSVHPKTFVITKCNSAFAITLGYKDQQEVLGTNIFDYLHEDFKNHNTLIEKINKNGRLHNEEVQFKHKNKQKIFTIINSYLTRNKNGKPKYNNSVITNITDLKLAQKEISNNEQRLKTIMENVNDGYWDQDLGPEGNEYLSPQLKKMLGYEDHELENKITSLKKLTSKEHIKEARENTKQHLESNTKIPYYQKLCFTHKNGSLVWVIRRGIALKDPKTEKYTRIVGTHTNISELVNTQEQFIKLNQHLKQELKQKISAIKEQKEFQDFLIDSLPLAMFCKDYQSGDGKYVAWNQEATKLWGLNHAQVINNDDKDIFPKNQADQMKILDLEAIKSGKLTFKSEITVNSPVLGEKIIRSWKVPIGKRYLLEIAQDITDNKALEKQLEEQKLVALQAAKMASLGEASAGIAHEINNPLAIIHGNTKILKQNYDNNSLNPTSFSEYTDTILATIDRIKKIVDGLRKLSRNDSQDILEPTLINELVKSSVLFCSEIFKSRGVDLNLNLLEEERNINCRKVQVSQVIINLLNNARVAVENLEPSWVNVDIQETKNNVVISVTDSGSGIPKNIRDKLFQAFFTTKGEGEGTGLGLSISRDLIKNQGGKLYLDETSKNTKFVIELPYQ